MTRKHCDQLLDYYNGHLSDIERTRFEKHLADCEECREDLQQLRELEEYLPFASQPVEPPQYLEDKVFANILEDEERAEVQPERSITRKTRWMFPSVAALLALSLIGNAYFLTQLGEEPEVAVEETVDQVLNFAELAAVEGDASGTASIVKQGNETRLVLQASNLEDLTDDEVYQVWLIKDEKPERAGTFTIEDGRGSVIFNFTENYENVDWDMVAVSQEPDAGSQLPQGKIVLASEL
ncbi:anti-sigma factor domain-containing protein [Bacillus sp. SCS-153A]|uniref:anti-sigma factor n=1 Tax=Rossellomorea sedimentorum TaxID=3115294 RepID=UPI003906B8A0